MKTFAKLTYFICIFLLSEDLSAQCPASYTQARLSWDNLNYWHNSSIDVTPYGNGLGGSYINNAMELTQVFALGPNSVTFATSAIGIAGGQNIAHTGFITGYGGQMASFVAQTGQTLTLTFNTEVQNVFFTLYDIDANAAMGITAKSAASVPQLITATAQTPTILAIAGSGTVSPTITAASAVNLANTDNQGTVTVGISGPVKTITINFTAAGSDPEMWLSCLYACVTGSFPINYHQMASEKPFTGQPAYFLTTPDNNSFYKVDPSNGKAIYLFSEPAAQFINSFAYDQINHILYYVLDGTASMATNKQLKKYDFNTDAMSTVLPDITTALNIPTFDQGVESGGAAFYNGNLYLGIEGGRYDATHTRYTNIYRLTMNGSGVPTNAAQVFSILAYDTVSGNTYHDFGDFLVKDGVLIDFNTARQGAGPFIYPNSAYLHYDLMRDTVLNNYINPTPANPFVGQGAMDWPGNVYSIRNDVTKYNMAGALVGVPQTIVVTRGPPWVGNSGDASEPFKPKLDFGDAPASFDPITGDPAVHEMDSTLRLGANFDIEFTTRGQTAAANSDNYDDGVSSSPPIIVPGSNYVVPLSFFNNTGSTATICAWVDFNGNGIFDPTEGISYTVNSNSAQQNMNLVWTTTASPLPDGSTTYMRIRITYSSNGMTTSNPTGYFNSGEVEDYRITLSRVPLAIDLFNYNAICTPQKTILNSWDVENEKDVVLYMVERSANSRDWDLIATLAPKKINSVKQQQYVDYKPLLGTSYYKLRILHANGAVTMTEVRVVEVKPDNFHFDISPNPSDGKTTIKINSDKPIQNGNIQFLNELGEIVYKQNIIIPYGIKNIQLNLKTLNQGLYFVRIETTENSYSKSIIIHK
ncbi:MAG: hypothetical protein NVS9B7_10670 [Flavisolibacter sp.]